MQEDYDFETRLRYIIKCFLKENKLTTTKTMTISLADINQCVSSSGIPCMCTTVDNHSIHWSEQIQTRGGWTAHSHEADYLCQNSCVGTWALRGILNYKTPHATLNGANWVIKFLLKLTPFFWLLSTVLRTKWSYSCMYLCMYMCVHGYIVCSSVHACVCTCLWKPEADLRCHPQDTVYLCLHFWSLALVLIWNLLIT